MELRNTVCVVTGGASGIGRALAFEFAARGAQAVVVADLSADLAAEVAERIGGLAVVCDVGDPAAVASLVATTRERFGHIDVFCSNAGYADPITGDLSASMDAFEAITRVNLLAHVAAAREVLPEMAERGSGYLLQTLSSAALIAGPAGAGYTMTKHGALGLAEWIAVHYRPKGVRVSCLCPNAVYTPMLGGPSDLDARVELPPNAAEMLLPEDVARQTADAMEGAEPFLILPHPRVGESFARKASSYDEWISRTADRLSAMRTD
jgi:NAD(P)-dependent dehydrogenase (short-subunit alcohol dehydrogenase family)